MRTLTIIVDRETLVKPIIDAYAYNDVLVMPGFSSVMPSQVNIATKFSRNIILGAPLSSSPMDTVTHQKLAIQMALLGGIGILDRNMSIDQQCNHVRSVKRYMSAILTDPYTLRPNNTVAHARKLMREKVISGIPITDNNGRLVGIITKHDLKFDNNNNSTAIKDVMTKDHLITAPIGTTPEQAQKICHATRIEKLPLVDGNNILKGLITLKDTEKKNMFPYATLDLRGQLRVGAAVGSIRDYYERTMDLIAAGADAIIIDSAHGHSANVIDALVTLKKMSGTFDVIAGNIATTQAARVLCEHGADAIKVGMGPGSICTTRIVTGVGVPQISAIQWVVEGVEDEIPVIADGGISFSGDITKAIAAGASSVMIGSLFAGTDESPGEKILYGGRAYKSYHGMGSEIVLQNGGDRYGSKAVPEGIEGMVPYKGPLALVFEQLIGGLRQGMGYAGCASIEELRKDSQLLHISNAGNREGHVHGVAITKQPPNYQIEQ